MSDPSSTVTDNRSLGDAAAPTRPNATAPAGHSLAVVIPVLDEAEILPELMRRLTAACNGIPNLHWQIIFVDDGSRDASAAIIKEAHQTDARFTLVRLSRNFGHQAAISAGLAHANTDAVVLMDADLQDPPEVIPALVEAWCSGGQVVLAQRRSRRERGLRRLAFVLFHRTFGWLTDFPIPANAGVFGLLDRVAARELDHLTERNRFLPGLRSWIGFDQRVVHYDRQSRAAGSPKQSYRRLFRYATDGVFSFSFMPLRMMTYLGLIVSIAGLLVALYFIVKRLAGLETAGTGFTTIVTLVLLLGGINLACLGLLGEYVGRIYDEVKNRPMYIVGSRVGLDPPPNELSR